MIILERFEESYAIIEVNGEMIKIERHLVDSEVKEGHVLVLKDGIYYSDHEATNKRKQYITDRFKGMWED